MNTIDIIIPIYNALDDLKKCLESVQKHTDLDRHRLILINDNSTDERIKPFLQEQRSERIIVIHNDKNMGFSNNINTGMQISKENDVILLNSDTIVTAGWVEKIAACAYQNRFCATVTPLSNNATLCSVPLFCEENRLPEGMSVDEAGEIVEKCSLRKYPRITVANGFCMLIKREVIQKIGYFDAATFGRGYGEENDFCNRAEQLGYCHLMCDDTFIFHSGTKSFVSKEKENYIKAHERILKERYPVQMLKNEEHVFSNPNHAVSDNVADYFRLFNARKNILLVGYSDFRKECEDHVGGTQLHVKHLVMGMREKFNIFVAARSYSTLMVTAYIGQKEYVYQFPIGPQPSFFTASQSSLAETFRNILSAFRIDLVHVHHTKKTSFDIYFEAGKQGIPVITTLHDFYSVCPSINMLDADNKNCIEQKSPDCRLCLKEKCGIYEGLSFLPSWREMYKKVLSGSAALVAPSYSAKDVFAKYYPELQSKVTVVGHGMDPVNFADDMGTKDYIESGDIVLDMRISYPHAKSMISIEGTITSCCGNNSFDQAALKLTGKDNTVRYLPLFLDQNNYFSSYLPAEYTERDVLAITPVILQNGSYVGNSKNRILTEQRRMSQNKKLRVAFIGGLNEIKGGKIAANLISSGLKGVEWFLFGIIGEAKLAAVQNDSYYYMGKYHEENLQDLLRFYHIDVVCILSIWPETFSYTLSEAILSDIPVIVTNTGALAERVSECGAGQIVDIREEEVHVLNTLRDWMEHPEQYRRYADAARKMKHFSIRQMADVYASLYMKYIKSRHSDRLFSHDFDARAIYEAAQGFETDCGKLAEGSRAEAERLRNELNAFQSTYTWKIVSRLTSLNFPLKHTLYTWLKGKNI